MGLFTGITIVYRLFPNPITPRCGLLAVRWYFCICAFEFVYLYICICKFVFLYLCLCVCIFVFVYLCISICDRQAIPISLASTALECQHFLDWCLEFEEKSSNLPFCGFATLGKPVPVFSHTKLHWDFKLIKPARSFSLAHETSECQHFDDWRRRGDRLRPNFEMDHIWHFVNQETVEASMWKFFSFLDS